MESKKALGYFYGNVFSYICDDTSFTCLILTFMKQFFKQYLSRLHATFTKEKKRKFNDFKPCFVINHGTLKKIHEVYSTCICICLTFSNTWPLESFLYRNPSISRPLLILAKPEEASPSLRSWTITTIIKISPPIAFISW